MNSINMNKSRFFIYALLLISFALINCKKKKEDPAPTTPVDTFKAKLQVKAGGVLYTFKEDSAGTGTAESNNPLGNNNEYTSSLTDPSSINGVIDVVKGTLTRAGTTTTNLEFKNFFLPGTYSFDANFPRNGVAIRWYDATNTIWSTDLSPTTQTGSTFTITEATEGTNDFGDYLLKVKITFNCTVYNSSGSSKVLTNGVYWGYFVKGT
jgi:hypothetical protein